MKSAGKHVTSAQHVKVPCTTCIRDVTSAERGKICNRYPARESSVYYVHKACYQCRAGEKHVTGAQHVKIPELIDVTMKVLTYHCVTTRSKAAFHYYSNLWNLQKVASCQLS